MSPSKIPDRPHDDEVPILIVGGGPSGLLLAYMLAQFNVQTLVVERYPTRLAAPKAHALSPRTLELVRQFGLDVNEIRRLGSPRSDAYWVNFLTSLSGRVVGRLPYERMDPDVLDATPQMIHNIPQPAFEELVARELMNGYSGRSDIRKNHSFVRLEQFEDHVLTTIEDRSSGREYVVKSAHVVACDGAKSAVRRYLGVECEGEDSYETMMTIHFNADLRPVIGDRVGMLHWIMDPETSGFIIGYDLSGNLVLICNFDSKKHPVESWNEALCRKTINAAIGTDAGNVPYDVLSYRPWILSRKVAKEYQMDRVFLAGDAAHSFPPTGGLGLNSGLGDVHNLAYKLAFVHQDLAAPSILSTYQSDRRQVALVNAAQSVKNGQQIFGLLKALGTTHDDVKIARENLHRNIEDPGAMVGINEGIEGQREHFDNLGLHIGYVYGDTKVPGHASVFNPVCVPGARVPHAWIRPIRALDLPRIDSSYVSELGEEEVKRKEYSTLDLVPVDGFIVLVDSAWGEKWKTIIADSRNLLPLPASVNAASALKLNTVVLDLDFEVQPGRAGEEWVRLMKLKQGQATLVRPDQHILATFDSSSSGPGNLVEALKGHLGW
ncbi:FAD binding domain-containing protein [Aspergillus undulatus]|uniref:FAD binding domain-containing protein n=1 Tax=Aspergillus undulatus TaxID=1810928 RepID=UPI003CCDAD34